MTDYDDLVNQLRKLDTEQINPDTLDIDRLSPLEIARKANNEDKKVAGVVEQGLESIARAAEIFADTLRRGGRVFYIGAGTSGRLGVLDAAECPPTFGTAPEQITGVVAGGRRALVLSIEGMEDNRQAAVADLKRYNLNKSDFVIGICASKRTPYTLAGLEYAASIRCKTAFVICNRAEGLPLTPDVLIELPVGPELIMGSTRLKSGTAQKMTLNMISTTAMVLLGKTYGNLMIDLQERSEKLAARSRRMLMDLLDITLDQAGGLLRRAGGSVKTAMVMQQFNCGKEEANAKLTRADGFLSRVE